MRPEVEVFDPNLTIAQWVLGQIASERLPLVAQDALEAGLDSPALRELAGEANPAMSDAGPIFDRALKELGLALMTRSEAGLVLAKMYARQILTGAFGPYEGARRIWREAWNRECDERLSSFVYWASEYEEHLDPDRRTECERGILEAARQLVGGNSQDAA